MKFSRRLLSLGFCLGLPAAAAAQATYRTGKAYEDTVRILVLSNIHAQGKCPGPTSPVGPKTRDFVLASLAGIPNVVSRDVDAVTWEDVPRIWPGKLPHVVVHVNAGWASRSGTSIERVLNTAADSAVGVVSIGDDASSFAERTFGFNRVDNVPEPMGDARQYRAPETSLWIDLDRGADTSEAAGIIRNTADSLKVGRLRFHPVEPETPDPGGAYRCQADADKYTVEPGFANQVTFLGFQRAFDGLDTVGGAREMQVIAAFQDRVRRGVALSYQPQFLADARAAHQITYDAVIFASFAHAHRNPPKRPDPPIPSDTAFPDIIRTLEGYPPVAGDSRLQPQGGLLWIPPVGYAAGVPYREHPLPVPGLPSAGMDPGVAAAVPEGRSLVRIIGRGRYLARVSIFDHLGAFVRSFRQSFGYRGELDNPARRTPLGLQSFLVWDMRDSNGALAGQGVYLWKVELELENGTQVERIIRTGLIRN